MEITVKNIKAIEVDSNVLILDAEENWYKEWDNWAGEATIKNILKEDSNYRFLVIDNETAFELDYYRIGTAVYHNETADLYVWIVSKNIKVGE